MNQYQIMDRGGDLRKYRTEIPNLVDDLDLSVYAFRLYVHLKRVCGDGGISWQSTSTLAEACKMSAGSVSNAKKELKDAGLIEVEKATNDTCTYDLITIVDIWTKNFTYFSNGLSLDEEGCSSHERPRSPHERGRSPSERKNINPIKKKPIKKDSHTSYVTAPELPEPAEDPLSVFTEDQEQDSQKSKSREGKKDSKPAVRFQIAAALAHVTGMDFEKNRGRLFREAKNFTDADLARIQREYGPGGLWYTCDWRGLSGEKPTLAHVRETWGNLQPIPVRISKSQRKMRVYIGPDGEEMELPE